MPDTTPTTTETAVKLVDTVGLAAALGDVASTYATKEELAAGAPGYTIATADEIHVIFTASKTPASGEGAGENA